MVVDVSEENVDRKGGPLQKVMSSEVVSRGYGSVQGYQVHPGNNRAKYKKHQRVTRELTLIMTVLLPMLRRETAALTAHQSNSTEDPIL